MSFENSLRKRGRSFVLLQRLKGTVENQEQTEIDEVPFYRKLLQPSLCLTPGCIHLHRILEPFLDLPLKITNTGVPNFTHKLAQNKHYCRNIPSAVFHLTCLSGIFLFSMFSIGRTIWLKITWKKVKNMEELFIYMLVCCLTIICIASWMTVIKYRYNLQFLVTQQFNLVYSEHVNDTKTTNTNPKHKYQTIIQKSLGDVFIYIFGSGFFLLAFVMLFVPLKLDYDPLSLVYKHFVGYSVQMLPLKYRILIQVGFGFVYMMLVGYGAGIILSFLLICIIFIESLQKLSNKLYPTNRKTLAPFKFSKMYELFRKIQILIDSANRITQSYLLLLLTVGVLLAGWSAYATLMMKSELPLITYLAMPVLVAIILAVNFILATFANVPNRNGDIFKQYWIGHLHSKEARKQLHSCPPIGYNVGPLRNVKLCLALHNTHAIVNCAVNIILLKLANS